MFELLKLNDIWNKQMRYTEDALPIVSTELHLNRTNEYCIICFFHLSIVSNQFNTQLRIFIIKIYFIRLVILLESMNRVHTQKDKKFEDIYDYQQVNMSTLTSHHPKLLQLATYLTYPKLFFKVT